MLLCQTEADKTQSRRQSGLVCSLLVVSLLLSAVVEGEECVQGILPTETVSIVRFAFTSSLYVFPSMNFSCNGTITDIRMRFLPSFTTQEVLVHFLLFHDGLNSPTRRVSHILLNQNNTQQESPNEIWRNSDPLSLPVTEGTFIGFAVLLTGRLTEFSRNINLSQSSERLEANIHQLVPIFEDFEGRLLEAARTADSSQFTTEMIAPPLIDVNFSPDSSTGLTPSPTAHSSVSSVRSIPPTSTRTTPPTETIPTSTSTAQSTETIPTSTSTPTRPQSTPTPGSPPSQLMIIVIAVVATTVLLLVVVVVVLVVVMVTVVCRRQSKRRVYENDDTDRGVSVQMTDNSTSYYEPMSLDVDPSHLHHQPHPLNTTHINTSAIGDHISMQECPAYQPIVDTPTSGDYTYI